VNQRSDPTYTHVCGCVNASSVPVPPASLSAYDFDRGKRMLELHAGLMLGAWALVIPTGALVPRMWRAALGPGWIHAHLLLQSVGSLLGLVGLFAAVDAMNALQLPHFNSDVSSGHKLMGLLVMLLTTLQLLAVLRPHKPHPGDPPHPRTHSVAVVASDRRRRRACPRRAQHGVGR